MSFFDSLGGFLKKAYDEVNPLDNGKTWSNPQGNQAPPAQPPQQQVPSFAQQTPAQRFPNLPSFNPNLGQFNQQPGSMPGLNQQLSQPAKPPTAPNQPWSFGRIGHDITHNPVTNLGGDLAKSTFNQGNQAYHTAAALGSTTAALRAQLTHNPVAYQNAMQAVKSDLAPGRAFVNLDEAQQGGSKLVKPVLNAGVQIAPLFAGVGATAEGAIARTAQSAALGSGTNVVTGGTQQLLENGKLNGKELAKSAALGAALGAGGELVHGAVGKVQTSAIKAKDNTRPLDDNGSINIGAVRDSVKNAVAPKYAGLRKDQIIMDPAKLDVLHEALAQHAGEYSKNPLDNYSPSTADRQYVLNGLHEIKADHGLDFVTGSAKDKAQSISQYLEKNGEAIDRLQSNNHDSIFRPFKEETGGAKIGDIPGLNKLIKVTDSEGNKLSIPANEWDAKAGMPKEFTEAPKPPKPGTDQYAEMMQEMGSKPKGFIISQSKPIDGMQDSIRISKGPDGHLMKTRALEPVPQGNLLTAKTFAETFGNTEAEAKKILASEPKQPPVKDVPNEPIPLSRAEKQAIIKNSETQQTVNKVELPNVEKGNIKGGIAAGMAPADERLSRFQEAAKYGEKLSDQEKVDLNEYLNGSKKLPKGASDTLKTAVEKYHDAYDYSLAADRAAGGNTMRWNQGKYAPLYLEAPPEVMDKLGIAPEDRITNGQYTGFRDSDRKYASYQDAAGASGGLLKPLYANAVEDAQHYASAGDRRMRGELLYQALKQAAPEHVADIGMGRTPEGIPFKQAAGELNFNASPEMQKYLKNFQKAWQPDSAVGKAVVKGAKGVNSVSKAVLFAASPIHYANVGSNFLGLTTGTGHFGTAFGGIADAVHAATTEHGYAKALENARQSGALDWARNNGMEINSKGRMGRFTNTLALKLAEAAHNQGVETGTAEATALAGEYNKVLGHKNYQVEGTSPNFRQAAQAGSLAPNWTPSQLGLVKDALTKGGEKGIGLYNAGDAARGAVVGKRVMEAALANIVSGIIAGQLPTLQQFLNRSGLNLNNPVPNIAIKKKNDKGEGVVLNLPTDPAGLAVGLASDPKHFLQSRYSPALAFGTRVVSNQDWNGNPLADMNLPGAWEKRVLGAAKGNLPISVQNLTNPNLSVKEGLLQDVGLRYKTDPNDPQIQDNKNYFDHQKQLEDLYKSGKLSQIDPSLQDVTPAQGMSMFNNEYAKANAKATKDAQGNNIPKDWDARSAQQKASYYLNNNNGTGAEQLSPTFYIEKKLAQTNPNRPHDAVFDLEGNGVGFTIDGNHNIVGSQSVPRAQIALEYNSLPASDDQKSLILDANPWLSDYQKQVGDNGANYKQQLTDYYKGQGWNDKAINQYFDQHPSSKAPIAPPALSGQTQTLMNQYGAITDPTEKAQFFTDNAAELAGAFKMMEQYKNMKAVAQGALPLQTHPEATPDVQGLLSQLQKNPNHDKSISRANKQLIDNNPSVAQYLADSGLYSTAKNLARYQFKDPSQPTLNQGQLLNLGRPIDQSTMKGISNLAAYDIGKNADGTYNFMQNGAVSGTTGSGGGYTKKTKKVFIKHKRIKMRNAHVRRVHLAHVGVSNGKLKISPKKINPVKIG